MKVKFSDETIQVLRNFSAINPDLLFKPGNRLRTVSQQPGIYAEATIKEEIPKEFGIYKMKRFLDAMGLIDDPELVFGDNDVKMTGQKNSIAFTYASPDIIISPPDREINLPPEDITFVVKLDDLNRVLKAAVAMELPDISFAVNDGTLSIIARDKKSKSSDSFRHDISEIESPDFTLDFKAEKLKLFPGDYTVSVFASGKAKAAKFTGEKITYVIAAELTSVYGG